MMSRAKGRICLPGTGGLLLLILACSVAQAARAQTSANERVFPQSKAEVEKALRTLQSSVAGRLPSLEGFAQLGEHPLDRYDRAYYQATVEVTTNPAGGARVRVSVKVTAWYKDPIASHSGYQLITSNGRIESDILDQLAEQLASRPAANQPEVAASTKQSPQKLSAEKPGEQEPAISAPTPRFPQSGGDFSSSVSQGLAAQAQASPQASSDKNESALRAQAASLEEFLKNQAHPNNLVAVKKSGTPVVASPSLTAKPLFLASLHDEFEMLDYTADWVHVRISGLSRGWIWRNSLEMPEGIPDTDAPAAAALKSAQDLFHVTREETAQFPGDWAPLRGKNVKIFSVQNTDEKAKETSADRLEFTKFLFEKNFAQLTAKPQELSGIVVIFDSVDGGMIAATVPTLQDWRAGTLSDSALWHKCFFDPPETFDSAGASASQ
jgi:hypothetical protein